MEWVFVHLLSLLSAAWPEASRLWGPKPWLQPLLEFYSRHFNVGIFCMAETSEDYQIANSKYAYFQKYILTKYFSFTYTIQIHWRECCVKSLPHICTVRCGHGCRLSFLSAIQHLFAKCCLLDMVSAARGGDICSAARRGGCSLEIKSIWNRYSFLRFFLYK